MLFEISNKNKNDIQRISRTTLSSIGWNEKDLENMIAKNMVEVIPDDQLMPFFQERNFKEEADIFALDKDGNLYIFELKRVEGGLDAVNQIMRYAVKFGQYEYATLNNLFSKYQKGAVRGLAVTHRDFFELTDELNKEHFNRKQKLILVTNGVDYDALKGIRYWARQGVHIEVLTYFVYKIGDKFLFEIPKYNPEGDVLIDEYEEGYYIVNTNLAYSNTNYKEMLSEKIAAAYYGKKWSILNIKKGYKVFLYHTGVGIIAFGVAIDNYKAKEINGAIEEEFYVPLRFDWSIDPDAERDKAISAWEINQALDSGHRFRGTCFSISPKMADTIVEISKNR